MLNTILLQCVRKLQETSNTYAGGLSRMILHAPPERLPHMWSLVRRYCQQDLPRLPVYDEIYSKYYKVYLERL
jgi:hypothetical protein